MRCRMDGFGAGSTVVLLVCLVDLDMYSAKQYCLCSDDRCGRGYICVCNSSLKLGLNQRHRTAHLLQTAEGGLLGRPRICYRAVAELPLIQVETVVVGAAPFQRSIGAAPPAHRCCPEGNVSALCDL